MLGGWALEGIVQLQSGVASNLRTGIDRANVGKTAERPNLLRNPNLPNGQRSVDRWFDTTAAVMPDFFTWGNAGAFVLEDDGRATWDISIAKRFRLAERHSLEFRTEMFNFPNHPDFGSPGTTLNTAAFGVISGATAARQIQFALRYMF